MNYFTSDRGRRIIFIDMKYGEGVSKIEKMFNSTDKKYGNFLTEGEKFRYVIYILEKERFKHLTYDDLNPIFFEKAKSRGVVQARTDGLDEETLKTLGSLLSNGIKVEELV